MSDAPESIVGELMRRVIENEEYLVREELVRAFAEHRPERNVQLPPRAWFDRTTRIVNLEELQVDHVYL